MSYGTPEWQGWVLDEEKSLPLLEHAYKVGLNTWDTVGSLPLIVTTDLSATRLLTSHSKADVYSNGRSEEIIGKALQKYRIPRQKVVILSKCYFGSLSPQNSL